MNAPAIRVKMAQHVLTEMNPTLALVRRDGRDYFVKIVSVYNHNKSHNNNNNNNNVKHVCEYKRVYKRAQSRTIWRRMIIHLFIHLFITH